MDKNDDLNAKSQGESKKAIFEKYRLKDIIFIILASVCMLVSCVDMPFIASVQVFGIGMLGIAFQVSFFLGVVAVRIRKTGAVLFASMILGLFHIIFAPQMILFSFIGGILAELLMMLFDRKRTSYLVSSLACSLPIPVIALMNIGWTFIFSGSAAALEALHINSAYWWVVLLVSVGVIALSLAGGFSGAYLIKRLRQKGVIHE